MLPDSGNLPEWTAVNRAVAYRSGEVMMLIGNWLWSILRITQGWCFGRGILSASLNSQVGSGYGEGGDY
jgi:hypothetical protein